MDHLPQASSGLDRVFGRPAGPRSSVIRRITNALTGEAVAPVRGPLAALSLWVEGLPDEADLNHMTVTADGFRVSPHVHRRTGKGRHRPGQCRAARRLAYGHGAGANHVAGPAGRGAGLGRVMPAGPSVPRVSTIADGINILSGTRIVTGSVKVTMREVADAAQFHATIDGLDALEIESFCADPIHNAMNSLSGCRRGWPQDRTKFWSALASGSLHP